jgi:hypothetical protein
MEGEGGIGNAEQDRRNGMGFRSDSHVHCGTGHNESSALAGEFVFTAGWREYLVLAWTLGKNVPGIERKTIDPRGYPEDMRI